MAPSAISLSVWLSVWNSVCRVRVGGQRLETSWGLMAPSSISWSIQLSLSFRFDACGRGYIAGLRGFGEGGGGLQIVDCGCGLWVVGGGLWVVGDGWLVGPAGFIQLSPSFRFDA